MSSAFGIIIKAARQRPGWAFLAIASLQALGIGILVVSVLRLATYDLSVPLNYSGDTLFYVTLVKGLLEEGWPSQITRLSAPFVFDAIAFPSISSTDWLVMKALGVFISSPGAVLNVFWIATILITGFLATLAFAMLGVPRWLAVLGGTVYALLPSIFIRNVAHISLVYYTVPFLAALCVHLAAGGRTSTNGKALFLLGLGAGLAQGLNYVYFSFFACILLLVAGVMGLLVSRTFVPVFRALAVAGLICVATLVNLWPSLSHWHENGKPPDMDYKSTAESEIYGLKLRRLILPSEGNVLRPLAVWARRDRDARFPNENENAASRLGPFAALGFLLGLTVLVWPRRLVEGETDNALHLSAASKLLFVTFLFTTVGGLGAVFNTLVGPQIRAYNRFSVFLAFFAVLVLCILFSQLIDRTPRLHLKALLVSAAVGLALFSIYDQLLDARPLVARAPGDVASARVDRAAVAELERLLPAGGMVFQMPVTGFPPDGGKEKMRPYDHARAFLWSKHLRWSWPSFSTQHRAWLQSVIPLEGRPLIERLALSGFDAIWLDRYGYKDSGAQVVARLTSGGAVALSMPGAGRYLAFDLRPVASFMQEKLGRRAFLAARHAILTASGVTF